MRAFKFVLVFSFAGVAIPILFTIFGSYYDLYISLHTAVLIEKLQLILWPSSILMISAADNIWVNYEILSISIIVNVVLYAMIGLLIWYGLNKQRWVLYVVFILIALGWYKLLSL